MEVFKPVSVVILIFATMIIILKIILPWKMEATIIEKITPEKVAIILMFLVIDQILVQSVI